MIVRIHSLFFVRYCHLSTLATFAGGGVPFVCGGRREEYNDQCFKYDAALDAWATSGTLAETRSWTGYGSSENWGLIMAGGYSDDSFRSSVETTDDGEVFGSLPNMPEANDYMCLVVVDDDRLFLCGGGDLDFRTSTLIFSKKSSDWTRQVHTY